MTGYSGNGKLIGYRNYKAKDGKSVHVYTVLLGDTESDTGLSKELQLISIYQDKQVLGKLEVCLVEFDVKITEFKGEKQVRYSNIRLA